MSETVQIGRWVLRPDITRTRAAHAGLVSSGAAACGCAGCANFEAVRPQLLDGPLGRILERLGISPPWEVEAYELGRNGSGLHEYGAWFHFVGTIESGPAAWRATSESTRVSDFEPLSPTLAVGFHTDLALVRKPFRELPLVQLDVSAQLPWVTNAKQP